MILLFLLTYEIMFDGGEHFMDPYYIDEFLFLRIKSNIQYLTIFLVKQQLFIFRNLFIRCCVRLSL